LFRHYLPGDAFPGRHVSGDVRDSEDFRLAGPMGRVARGFGSEDRAPAPDLPGPPNARLRSDHEKIATKRHKRRKMNRNHFCAFCAFLWLYSSIRAAISFMIFAQTVPVT